MIDTNMKIIMNKKDNKGKKYWKQIMMEQHTLKAIIVRKERSANDNIYVVSVVRFV